MLYLSTRGHADRKRFCDILLGSGSRWRPVPARQYPQIDDAKLSQLRETLAAGYAALAFEILSLYIDDIPADDLRALCAKTYTKEVRQRRHRAVRQLDGVLHIEALSNGPTLAFKDMAMQLLGNLFEYELARRNEELNILGATSGTPAARPSTPCAAKRACASSCQPPRPHEPFQQAQMFSLQDANIHNIAIEGVFDDCQDIVKAVSNDHAFKAQYKIGTVNSINWARLLAQVVYYFAGYLQATSSNDQKVSFTVPSGNFGNICAGHVARQMGLPIAKLVVATNENDVLDEFFRTGVYRARLGQYLRDIEPLDGHLQGQQFRALCVRPGGATACAPSNCSPKAWPRRASSI
jgi:threonine synthase